MSYIWDGCGNRPQHCDRDLLIAIIVRQQAIIERLEKRVAQLEGRDKAGGTRRMPGLSPKPSGGRPSPRNHPSLGPMALPAPA